MPGLSSDSPMWPLLNQVLAQVGMDWRQLLLAWGRALPLVLVVPAFGSRLMPAQARAVFGLGLAAILVPVIAPIQEQPVMGMWVLGFIDQLARGLPVALSSAAMIWAAMMAGGVVDDLRGATQQQSGIFPDANTPLSALLGLFSVLAFLQLGGVESAVGALSQPVVGANLMLRTVGDVVYAVQLAFALAAPILCVSVVWEVAGALVARAASPAHVQALLAPLRSIVVLGAFALILPGLFDLVGRMIAARLR